MAHNAAYPEPDAGSEAIHPYTNQFPHSQAPHPAEAPMRRASNPAGSSLQGDEYLAAELAQRSLDMNQAPDSSLRKRSKVSRACDECRRKKVKLDMD